MPRRRLHRALRALVLVPLAVVTIGMGRQGVRRDADVHATLVDRDGRRVEVNHLTIGADVAIEGDLGRGRLRVPLDTVGHIALAPSGQDRDRMSAAITLRHTDPVVVDLLGATPIYGRTAAGAFTIRARDLRTITVHP